MGTAESHRRCVVCAAPLGPTKRRHAIYCTDVCGGRARNRRFYKAHEPAIAVERRRRSIEVPLRGVLARTKHRAAKLGVPFDLEIEDVRAPSHCPVLGIRLVRGHGRGGWQDASPSLDRIVPELGYVRGNVRVISARANLLKSNATLQELEAVLADLRRLRAHT